MKLFLFLTLPLYVLDQVTKCLVLHFLAPYQEYEIIPGFFSLVHITNTGAAVGPVKNKNNILKAR
jgi:lipoprotein signal peptidase